MTTRDLAWATYEAANARARHAYRTDPHAGTRALNLDERAVQVRKEAK